MSDDLVTIATYMSFEEAYIARGLLQANDIDALVDDGRVTGIFGALVPNPAIRLKVHSEEAERAAHILATDASDVDLSE